MSGRGGNRSETFTVPEGRRAVVRSMSVLYWGAAGSSAFLYVHGIPLYYFVSLAANHVATLELRLTAYEGETIEMRLVGSDLSYALDGFLYADDDGRPDDKDNVITPLFRDQKPRPDELPA